MGFQDAVDDALGDFSGDELFDMILESPNATKEEEGISFLCSSEETGAIEKIEFDLSAESHWDLRRALSSVRIVDLKEKVH